MFMWDEGDLNDEQIAAINEPNNVFLVACPGSGKTRTLTYKIASELSGLEDPKKNGSWPLPTRIEQLMRFASELKFLV